LLPASGNRAVSYIVSEHPEPWESALKRGVPIGPRRRFPKGRGDWSVAIISRTFTLRGLGLIRKAAISG
jgi:hypothetical protein